MRGHAILVSVPNRRHLSKASQRKRTLLAWSGVLFMAFSLVGVPLIVLLIR